LAAAATTKRRPLLFLAWTDTAVCGDDDARPGQSSLELAPTAARRSLPDLAPAAARRSSRQHGSSVPCSSAAPTAPPCGAAPAPPPRRAASGAPPLLPRLQPGSNPLFPGADRAGRRQTRAGRRASGLRAWRPPSAVRAALRGHCLGAAASCSSIGSPLSTGASTSALPRAAVAGLPLFPSPFPLQSELGRCGSSGGARRGRSERWRRPAAARSRRGLASASGREEQAAGTRGSASRRPLVAGWTAMIFF